MDSETKKTKDVCPGKKLSLEEVKDKLTEARGPKYWRTLDELAETPEFDEMLHREFPRYASEWKDKASRRDFLKIMGASMALAGLSGCVKLPLQPIVPYVRQPEGLVPGKPQFYASAFALGAYGIPVLVESHEGRPTKIEGNPQSPSTLGGTDVYSQASVLGVYDPDRSQGILNILDTREWGSFVNAVGRNIADQRAKGGAGLRFLTGATSSPTFVAQMHDVLRQFPQAKWYQWEPINRDNVYAGAQAVFGQPVETQYNFEKAKVILSLDGDFLSSGFPGFHKYARQFGARRRPELKHEMVRFYAVESSPTNTGGKADHRLRVKASEVEAVARALAAQLGVAGGGGSLGGSQAKFVAAAAKDLQANHGRAVVVAGDNQPAAVHAMAHLINQQIGAVGATVVYTDPIEPTAAIGKTEQLKQLAGEMYAGKVEMLVVMGVNPVYDAPADVNFVAAMNKVPLRIHHGLYQDETSKYCHWHVNASHYLEGWSDVRAFDGTVSLIQPLIAPLYGGRSEHELLSFFLGQPEVTSFEAVQRYWQSQQPGGDFNVWWRKALHDGFIAGSAFAPKSVAAKGGVPASPTNAGGFELIFRRDYAAYDGRFSNNPWLQEMPKPITQVCWDNPVLLSVATGQKLGVKTEDVVEIEAAGQKVKGAVWLTPGHPDDSATVLLGYGRELAGRVGSGLGYNGYKLRSSDKPWFSSGKITRTGEQYGLASPQGHQSMDGRALVRAATLDEFIKHPDFAREMVERPGPGLTLYHPYEYKEHKWGMVIDMNSCIGCKTCTVACQSENNIAVVGKLEVKRGRHMNWLRVDNYHEGSPENPKTYYQPVPCMQCENAPCEVVCPVGATVHSTEGLNDMVYNRCVGTRYCSNNCPYKVRRFNFLLFSDWDTPQTKMVRNPDVTVRSRGVMEKCTYCIQRITAGRITAEQESRKVRDGEVMTACQQACPAGAIVFGDLNDPNSLVSKLVNNERNYGLLEDLNTRPRTTYMAVVGNPNPELEGKAES